MSEEKFVYVQNTHNAPISANARDKSGRILFTKKFMPQLTDKWTGKVITTGYVKLTEAEYEKLKTGSRTFKHYSEELKFLVVHDEIPADLKSPHEALVDARKEARKAAGKIAQLETELVTLKAKLLDAETKYGELTSASGSAGGTAVLEVEVAALKDDITVLQDANAGLESKLEAVTTNRDVLRELVEQFALSVERHAGGNEDLMRALAEHREALDELDGYEPDPGDDGSDGKNVE